MDKVLVVDVEDRDDSAYREVTTTSGGVSGWRLLWDRLCPFQRLRYHPRMLLCLQLRSMLQQISGRTPTVQASPQPIAQPVAPCLAAGAVIRSVTTQVLMSVA